MATGDKLVTLDELKAVKDYITPANIGAKATQTAVSSPTASGTASAFIDTISQDAQGKITATKKTVAVTGVKGNSESSYKTGNVNLTAANVGAKATQTAVSSPTASGTATAFIDTISQNTQGVISATKKNITAASISAYGSGSLGAITDANDTTLFGCRMLQGSACSNLPSSASGVYFYLMCSGILQVAIQHDGTGTAVNAYVRFYANSQWYAWRPIISSVSGIKGNSESSYRTGNVNLTPANIGALALSGGTMTGTINMGKSGTTSSAKIIQWTTADDTTFAIRPYNNLFQIVRTPSGESSKNALGIYSDGTVNVESPANWRTAIGAHQAGKNLVISSISSYSGTVSEPVSTNMVQIKDTSSATVPIRHQMYGSYDTDGYTSTHFAARVPALGSQSLKNAEIVISVNNSGNVKYKVSEAKAFRSAIEAPGVLEINSNSWSTIYGLLSKIPLESAAVVNCTSTFMGAVDTNGSYSGRFRGIVSTTANNGDYDFVVSGGAANATQHLYAFRISGLTSSSATPTINKQGKIAFGSW